MKIIEHVLRMTMKESQEAIKTGYSPEKKAQKREDFVARRLVEGKSKQVVLTELEQEG